MKTLCSLVSVFLSVCLLYGQEFLTSPDYVYGCAKSSIEGEADSLAILSFSRCVMVKITNSTHRSIVETNIGVDEQYSKTLSIVSDINVSGLKKYIEYYDGVYTVYYYLNKKSYIDESLSAYHKYIGLSESVKAHQSSHAENMRLGYLYLAYMSVSDDMLCSLYPQANVIRRSVINELTSIYNSSHFLLSGRNYGPSEHSTTMRIREENKKPLPGFEYKNKDGEWVVPKLFCDNGNNECDKYNAVWAFVHNPTNEYRLLFEIETEYGIVKLDVPDEFYSNNLQRKSFF